MKSLSIDMHKIAAFVTMIALAVMVTIFFIGPAVAQASNPCELDGTCDHTDDLCDGFEDASFCKGPSDQGESRVGPPESRIRECAEQGLWPEWDPPHECTEEALEFEVILNSPPEPTQPTPTTSTTPELPRTGVAHVILGLIGAGALGSGTLILRRTR